MMDFVINPDFRGLLVFSYHNNKYIFDIMWGASNIMPC